MNNPRERAARRIVRIDRGDISGTRKSRTAAFNDNIFAYPGSEVSALWPDAIAVAITDWHEMGICRRDHLDAEWKYYLRAGDLRAADDLTIRPGDYIRTPRRHDGALAANRRLGIYPAVDPLDSSSRLLEPRW
jgi:hypothetical protein